MRLLILIVLSGLILAGCAKKPLEINRITKIKPSNGAKGLDVYAHRRRAGEQVPQIAGDQIVPIRTYVSKGNGFGGGLGDEISGASCVVSASNFSAKVKTPAKVRVPIYRMQSSQLSVSCEKQGYAQKTVDYAVYNKTKNDRYAMGGQAGVLGVIAIAAINGMSDDNTHDYLYPPLKVALVPKK